jgi:hypothetical protein
MGIAPPDSAPGPHISAQIRTFRQPASNGADKWRAFAGLSRGGRGDKRAEARSISGVQKMLGLRIRTGLGGLFAVTSLLLAMQLVTGTQAFPL